VIRDGDVINVRSGRLERSDYRVEGDYSSASYWFAAAAATHGTMRVRGLAVPTAQGDAGFLDILNAMGCAVDVGEEEITVTGPETLQGGTFDCNETPDIVPTLAAIAPLAASPVEIVNVANLRVKESDRLATVTSELRRLGATVEERPDSLLIQPGWSDEPATVETHNDHRIAMAFAIAGLARGNVTIAREQVVTKSYPRFWRTLDEATLS
jgi:3-phosphoshikimate 1-carboxyvinyltransferase